MATGNIFIDVLIILIHSLYVILPYSLCLSHHAKSFNEDNEALSWRSKVRVYMGAFGTAFLLTMMGVGIGFIALIDNTFNYAISIFIVSFTSGIRGGYVAISRYNKGIRNS